MASDEQAAEALKAAISAQMPASADVLDHDEHQGNLKTKHVQFGCSRRNTTTERGGVESLTGFRASTRVVADTVSNARELQRRVDLALLGVQITVAGVRTSPVRRESQDDIEPDEGLYSALTTWTFTR